MRFDLGSLVKRRDFYWVDDGESVPVAIVIGAPSFLQRTVLEFNEKGIVEIVTVGIMQLTSVNNSGL